jgi:hypothetical protein
MKKKIPANKELYGLWVKWNSVKVNDDSVFCGSIDSFTCEDCPYNTQRGIRGINPDSCSLYGYKQGEAKTNLSEYNRVVTRFIENLEMI